MKGVEPSGPRALSNFASAATSFMNLGRSPSWSASTMATALGLTGRNSASLASASGQSAPCSIQRLMVSIWSGLSAPVGGHLQSVVVAGDTVEQEAVLGAAGHDAAAIDHRAFAVQPHAAGRLRATVARDTVLAQDREHILREIYF